MRRLPVAALLCLFIQPAWAADVTVIVMSQSRAPISDAVVTLSPTGGDVSSGESPKHAVMVQEHQQFAPFVLPIRVGTTVEFPNRDSFRHHVYSFSPAKTFELKLYGGGETQTVTFDVPGAVALGCNIHDNMLAYIYVVETPYFAKTSSNGRAVIQGVPPGNYEIAAWHPNQKSQPSNPTGNFDVVSENNVEKIVSIEMKRDRRPRQPGAFDEQGY